MWFTMIWKNYNSAFISSFVEFLENSIEIVIPTMTSRLLLSQLMPCLRLAILVFYHYCFQPYVLGIIIIWQIQYKWYTYDKSGWYLWPICGIRHLYPSNNDKQSNINRAVKQNFYLHLVSIDIKYLLLFHWSIALNLNFINN